MVRCRVCRAELPEDVHYRFRTWKMLRFGSIRYHKERHHVPCPHCGEPRPYYSIRDRLSSIGTFVIGVPVLLYMVGLCLVSAVVVLGIAWAIVSVIAHHK